MQRIPLSPLSRLLQAIASPANPGRDLDNDLRFTDSYVGDVRTPFEVFGGFGFLPVCGFGDGDWAALRALPGRSVDDWPVVRVSHIGAGCRSFASSLSTLVPGYIASFGIHSDRRVFAERKQEYVALAGFLGDQADRTQGLIGAMMEGSVGPRTHRGELLDLALGPDNFLSRFHATWDDVLLRGNAAGPAWASYVESWPFFACGHHMHFLAAREEGDEAGARAAWNVVTAPQMFDNAEVFTACKAAFATGVPQKKKHLLCIKDPFREAARFLVNEGGADKYGSDPRWPAVEAVAAGEPSGRLWLEAAHALLAGKHYSDAYDSALTAAHLHHADFEEPLPEARDLALRCARGLKDTLLVSLLSDDLLREQAPARDSRGSTRRKKGKGGPTKENWFEAAQTGNVALLNEFIEAGALLEAADDNQQTALLLAAGNGHVDAVACLLENGADGAARDAEGQAAIHAAATAGHLRVVQYLVEARTNLDEPTAAGQTPLQCAVWEGQTDVALWLVQNGADLTSRNILGDSAIASAVTAEFPELALRLVEAGVPVHLANEAGVTALHRAAASGYTDVVRALLRAGASADAKTTEGETPYDWARSEGQTEAAALLAP